MGKPGKQAEPFLGLRGHAAGVRVHPERPASPQTGRGSEKARPSPAPVRTRRGRHRFAPGEPAEVVMALYDLSDRLNWQQACEVLGCRKTFLYQLAREGKIRMYGAGKRCRWFSREDCEKLISPSFFSLDNGSLKATIQQKKMGNSNVQDRALPD